ncbi:MAG: alpha/beta fold hydrolase [Croceitalea sp.]|nr:alpha/beta fold hydrolase [Croceitalea sp.]
MHRIILITVLAIFSIHGFAQDISGDWMGTLPIRDTELDFGFHITKNENSYSTLVSVPQQGPTDMDVKTTLFVGDTLKIADPTLQLEYTGVMVANEFEGNITLGAQTFPLVLKKGKIALNRPQEPKAPFSYYSEEVTFMNKTDKIALKGTLTLPKKRGKFPLAIIISGSGPQNRDGAVFGHKPYYVIADHLTNNGVAVLRFDERGVGESEGDFATAAIDEFTSDIHAAVAYAKSRKEIKVSKIGLIGHSIGGIIAPKVAAANADIGFLVLLAGPGVNGDQLMLSQKAASERIMGVSEFAIAQGQQLMKGGYDIIIASDMEIPKLKDSINSFYLKTYGNFIPENQRNRLVDQITGHEFVSLIKSKPSTALSKVKCPVLALNGSKDFQVPAKDNLAAIKQALEENGNTNVKTVELEQLNHLFQECATGAKSEYAEIEQTIAPAVLELITEWVTEQTK